MQKVLPQRVPRKELKRAAGECLGNSEYIHWKKVALIHDH